MAKNSPLQVRLAPTTGGWLMTREGTRRGGAQREREREGERERERERERDKEREREREVEKSDEKSEVSNCLPRHLITLSWAWVAVGEEWVPTPAHIHLSYHPTPPFLSSSPSSSVSSLLSSVPSSSLFPFPSCYYSSVLSLQIRPGAVCLSPGPPYPPPPPTPKRDD